MTHTIDDDVVTDHAPTGVQWITGNVTPDPLGDLAGSCAFDEGQTHRTVLGLYEWGADDLDEAALTYPSRNDAVAALDTTMPADPEDWRAYALVPAQLADGEEHARGDAWSDLLCALALVAGRPGTNPDSPFHCHHDVLILCADPRDFTAHELAQLTAWGFLAERDAFASHRYGSA